MSAQNIERRGLSHAQVEIHRHCKDQSILLFITDRCPVGCLHCSVDSRVDSPTITNFGLFSEILSGICGKTSIQVVGISGGEPFAERRGLLLASSQIVESGKLLVIYTSGVWAKAAVLPEWILKVLQLTNTVYLSTDTFHQKTVSPIHFVRAAQAIANAGAWIVVQTLDVEQAKQLLQLAFGNDYTQHSEIVPLTPLTNGRGKDVFVRTKRVLGKTFGTCNLAVTPVVRYDGLVTGCCNESVIMGHGPMHLRRRISSQTELNQALDYFRSDPLLRTVSGVGLGALTEHPLLRDFAERQFTSNCDLCWKVMDKFPEHGVQDRLIHAIAELEETP
ncbi:MAG: radical SAM protein [Limnobacter sp.]|nr:radical SAM protein [Limnobacter sp.]